MSQLSKQDILDSISKGDVSIQEVAQAAYDKLNISVIGEAPSDALVRILESRQKPQNTRDVILSNRAKKNLHKKQDFLFKTRSLRESFTGTPYSQTLGNATYFVLSTTQVYEEIKSIGNAKILFDPLSEKYSIYQNNNLFIGGFDTISHTAVDGYFKTQKEETTIRKILGVFTEIEKKVNNGYLRISNEGEINLFPEIDEGKTINSFEGHVVICYEKDYSLFLKIINSQGNSIDLPYQLNAPQISDSGKSYLYLFPMNNINGSNEKTHLLDLETLTFIIANAEEINFSIKKIDGKSNIGDTATYTTKRKGFGKIIGNKSHTVKI